MELKIKPIATFSGDDLTYDKIEDFINGLIYDANTYAYDEVLVTVATTDSCGDPYIETHLFYDHNCPDCPYVRCNDDYIESGRTIHIVGICPVDGIVCYENLLEWRDCTVLKNTEDPDIKITPDYAEQI